MRDKSGASKKRMAVVVTLVPIAMILTAVLVCTGIYVAAKHYFCGEL